MKDIDFVYDRRAEINKLDFLDSYIKGKEYSKLYRVIKDRYESSSRQRESIETTVQNIFAIIYTGESNELLCERIARYHGKLELFGIDDFKTFDQRRSTILVVGDSYNPVVRSGFTISAGPIKIVNRRELPDDCILKNVEEWDE